MLGTSCQDDGEKVESRVEFQRPIVTQNPPSKQYAIADTDCLNSEEPTQIRSTDLYGWGQAGLSRSPTALVGMESRESLTNPFIRETLYNRLYYRECDYQTPEGRECRTVHGGQIAWLPYEKKKLRVCKDNHRYPRNSYEAAGLISAHYLQKAHQRYLEVRGTPAIEPVSLEIMPLFVTRFQKVPSRGEQVDVDVYNVNNLAYFPASNMIAVFPATENSMNAAASQPHLHEVAFAHFHEFAHRVETTLIGDRIAELGYEWSPFRHSYRIAGAKRGGGSALQLRLRLMWSAFSEGFADALSFITGGESSGSLAYLIDPGLNRDPAYPEFTTGEAKVLDSEKLGALYSAVSDGTIRRSWNARGIDFRDPHMIGQILAHATNRIFEVATNEAGLVDRARGDAKYEMTLDWLLALHRSDRERGTTIEETGRLAAMGPSLEASIDAFFDRAGLAGSDRLAAQEEVFCLSKELLPAVSPKPYEVRFSDSGCEVL